MFQINNDDLSIYATRGDTVFFTVTAADNGTPYYFQAGDVLRMKIFGKKAAENVVMEKLFPITAKTDRYTILLTEEDTKIGDVISKPVDYWYEIELNPFTDPQTIIAYDEDGPKVFRLYPEGADTEVVDPDPEDIPVVDTELDMTSTRPVQNQAIARAIVNLEYAFKVVEANTTEKANILAATAEQVEAELAVERARIDNLLADPAAEDGELVDIRVGGDGVTYGSAGTAVRSQYAKNKEMVESLCEDTNNLFDPTTCFERSAVSSDGDMLEDESYWRTAHIQVNGISKVTCTHRPYKVVFFDAERNALSAVTSIGNLNTLEVPESAYYAVYQFANERVAFADRYEVSIYSDEHDFAGKRYAIAPEAIGGNASAVFEMLKVDENNLFDPLMCADNRAISGDGEYFEDTGYWCSGYLNVAGTSAVVLDFKPHKIVWYDSNKAFVSATVDIVAKDRTAKPTGAVYMRVQADKATVAYENRFALKVCCIEHNLTDIRPRYMLKVDSLEQDITEMMNLFGQDTRNLLNPLKCMGNMAFATATGEVFASSSYWLTDFIPVDGITNVKCNRKIYKYAWFDSAKNLLAANADAPDGAAFLLIQFAEATVPYDSRFQTVVCDSSLDLEKVKPYYHLREKADKSVSAMGEYKFSIELASTPYMSDHTFINGLLYVINASSDDHSEYTDVTVYDVNTDKGTFEHTKTFQHNLGHANSIDYCEANGCLILGNGSNDSSLPGEIYILPEAANRDTWEYNDCIKIDVSGENWGIKTNVVWGEHNNGEHNIAYVITNNNANVRKILLTKTDGEFDGGYILLNEWETEAIDVNQGSVYRNGKLYIAIGHSQVWMIECTLNSDGTITAKQHKDIFYDADGNVLTTPFAEGITVEDGYLYFGASSGEILVYDMAEHIRMDVAMTEEVKASVDEAVAKISADLTDEEYTELVALLEEG